MWKVRNNLKWRNQTPKVFSRGFITVPIGDILNKETIFWKSTSNPIYPYKANIEGHDLELRVNDFPDEPLYTVIKRIGDEEEEIKHTNGFQNNWMRDLVK